jgi:hypothetical protein
MPQGIQTWIQDPPGRGRTGSAGLPRLARPAFALSVFALLAACGQTTQQPTTHGAARSSSSHSRPASYDPPGPAGDPWGPWIREASRRFDVPERWVREVMRQESGGRVSATSPVGAMGLMQVMPGTYRELRARYGLGDDPYHPYDSIMAGTAYIREMYDLYGSPAFLAAYNAGPRRLEDYLWNSRGLPTETRNYVARIGPRIVDAHPHRRAAPEIYAAAEIPLSIPPGPRRMDSATMLALREQRQAQQPGIQVAQLPAGPVVRMEPIPDGSTFAQAAPLPTPSAAPVRLASLDAGPVVRMEPIPDGSTPEGAARLAESDNRGVAEAPLPAPAPAAPPPVVMAAPVPPSRSAAAAAPVVATRGGSALARPALAAAPPPAPRATSRAQPILMASANAAPAALPARQAAPVTAQPVLAQPAPGRSFGIMGVAQASTLSGAGVRPAVASPSAGIWAVQVGAFASEGLARSAANTARDSAGTGARAVVQPIAQGRSTLYRARVIGLSQSTAQSVCDRLRSRGACMVLSPDAQG